MRSAGWLMATLVLAHTGVVRAESDECGDFFRCLQGCDIADGPCDDECRPSDPEAAARLDALRACVASQCPDVALIPLGPFEECALTSCPDEAAACGEVGYGTGEPCPAGLSFTGRCEGDTVLWCEQGEAHGIDCGATGNACGYSSGAEVYDCVTPGTEPLTLTCTSGPCAGQTPAKVAPAHEEATGCSGSGGLPGTLALLAAFALFVFWNNRLRTTTTS